MRDEHQARIGAQIASLRERQGWSQRALAKWVDLDQSAVSRIEAGRRRLSAEELHRFAEALHVTADVLLKGDFGAPEAASRRGADPARSATSRRPASGAPPVLRAFSPENSMELGDAPDAEPVTREVSAFLEESPSLSPDVLMERHAAPARSAPAPSPGGPRPGARGVSGLPPAVEAVARDWSTLRRLAESEEPAQRWSTGHSAEGKPERLAHTASPRPGGPAGDVLYDRVARFWRSELHVEPENGPLPDLVPLLEDGYGAQVIVARVAGGAPGTTAAAVSADHPVAAAFSEGGVPFIFVNAGRPVVLQRFALAHAFAHHVLGHGDVVDRRIEWSRNVPPEAAANDFAEELLAPVRAVQRWYERREVPRWVRLEDLLDLANAFGISVWSALYRSRAAGRLGGKQYHVLRSELDRHEWQLLPRQAFLGGLRDTLSLLTPAETLPPREFGGPAVLRVPAPMRAWALAALQSGRLSLEDAAALLRLDARALAEQLARLGLE